jgi:membrane-associated phospholipid phosphatase
MHISEGWITTIVGGAVAAVLAGLVLYLLLPPSHSIPQDLPLQDVLGTQPCTRSDGGPGVMGTHEGRAYCFATRKKRHTEE